MIWIQALIILACIMLGARKSGVAMGFAGGVGLFILVFVFGLKPASPPVNVLLIIIAVSSMAATLQVAGGLDLLVHLAEKVLRSCPFGQRQGIDAQLERRRKSLLSVNSQCDRNHCLSNILHHGIYLQITAWKNR